MTAFNITLGTTEVSYPIGRDEDGFECFRRVDELIACATTARGERWTTEPLAAGTTADAVGTPETRPGLWLAIDPIYGSEAWGPENEYELACAEADAFNEPRPRWL